MQDRCWSKEEMHLLSLSGQEGRRTVPSTEDFKLEARGS